MLLTQKSQYALRAVFELSRRYGQGPVKAPAIAHAQGIPVRFLEVILNQLKHGRLIEAKRGVSGGYYLLKRPDEISLADVIFFIQGPPRVISKEAGERKKHGKHLNIEAFNHVWKTIEDSISQVYSSTTFKELLDRYSEEIENKVATYSI